MATNEAGLLEVPHRQYEEARTGSIGVEAERGSLTRSRVITLPWQRVALGAILVLAALLNGWQLDRLGYGNSYYAAAVRSMMQSWHNFFFNSFDPGGFVTIDKPPLAFWFQVISARIFGYNGISLLLPSVVAGILSVWLVYYLVQRVSGPAAGLIAALVMAVTPVAVATNRSNIVDSVLVLFLILGAWAVSRAVEKGSLRWLLLCAALIGLGFNVKMLAAYLVVPALGLVYLLGASIAWWKRIGHLALATVVLLTVSLSWAVAVDLTPASQRPWVDSTTSNSEVDLAIGYNGLQRLTGQNRFGGRPGTSGATRRATTGSGNNGPVGTRATAQPSIPADLQRTFNRFRANGGGPGGPGGLFNNGAVGPLRLLDQQLGGQASWLLPIALMGLLVVATRRRIRFPLGPQENAALLWGGWLLTAGAFYSVAGFFHSYYLVTLAPPIAALVGIGLMVLWQAYRQAGWRGWLLPFAVLLTTAAQVSLLQPYTDWNGWLTPVVVGASLLAAVILIVARLNFLNIRLVRWTPLAAALGVLALLVAPTAWAADTTINSNGGMTPAAGPSSSGYGGPFGGRGGRGGFGSGFGGPDSGSTNSGLLSYLEKNQGSTKYLLAVQNSNSAASYIIQTGKPVMSLGGFGGSDPILTLSQLQALIKNNTVRYFSGMGGFGGNSSIGQWVANTCSAVPASAYGASSTTTLDGPAGGFGQAGPAANGTGGFTQASVQGTAGGFGTTSNAGTAGATGTPGGFGVPPTNGGSTGQGGFPGGFPGSFGSGNQLYDCAGAVK